MQEWVKNTMSSKNAINENNYDVFHLSLVFRQPVALSGQVKQCKDFFCKHACDGALKCGIHY